jgi:hypothetical protein
MEKTTNDAGSLKINDKEEHRNDAKSHNYEESAFGEITLTNLEELGAFTGFNFPDVPAWSSSNNFEESDINHGSYISSEVSDVTNEKNRTQERATPKFNMNSPLAYYSGQNASPIIIQNNLELRTATFVQNNAEVTNLPPVAQPDKIRPPNQKSTIILSREGKYNIQRALLIILN